MSKLPKHYTDDLLAAVMDLQKQLPCCPNCVHFRTLMLMTPVDSRERDVCALDPQRRTPPSRVIAFGCERFEADIPF